MPQVESDSIRSLKVIISNGEWTVKAQGLNAIAAALRMAPLTQSEREKLNLELSMPDTANECLTTPIHILGLGTRARGALLRAGIRTIGQLTNKTEAELLQLRNFGWTSLSEVKTALAGHGGLKLRDHLTGATSSAANRMSKPMHDSPRPGDPAAK